MEKHSQEEAQPWRKAMEKVRNEKIRDEKDQTGRKGRKVAKHCVFYWFVAPEGRKVGSLKRRVRSQLARWKMNNCTPFWREAHFEVNAKKCQNTLLGALLELAMSKKCTPLWREAHLEVKMYKTPQLWSTFGSWGVEKVHGLGHAHFQVKSVKSRRVRTTFGSWDVQKVHAVAARSTTEDERI